MSKVFRAFDILQQCPILEGNNGWKETTIILKVGEWVVFGNRRIDGPGKVWLGESPNGIIKMELEREEKEDV
jgi:hypothetical protein